ncbi:hypothetical protein U27_01161 [Candidatus Vecturithrix granuli]|uniref:Lipoprotein n=1 Tax=Vecturithrix granuli TaxID=1499967 RepID=A0A081C9K6_VECG1|nr:hypothetical protein U27_01161 [Candidatus Vecturithrix granuli]
MKTSILFLWVFSLFFILSACHHHALLSDRGGVDLELAPIDRIELLILESFPVQVHVRITGYLPDSCTTFDHISQTRVENLFQVDVITKRPVDEVCAKLITWFEETVALEVYGLPAGTYIVDVNGVRETFTLDVENRL